MGESKLDWVQAPMLRQEHCFTDQNPKERRSASAEEKGIQQRA